MRGFRVSASKKLPPLPEEFPGVTIVLGDWALLQVKVEAMATQDCLNNINPSNFVENCFLSKKLKVGCG